MAQTRRRLPCLRGGLGITACRAHVAPIAQNHFHFVTTSTYQGGLVSSRTRGGGQASGITIPEGNSLLAMDRVP